MFGTEIAESWKRKLHLDLIPVHLSGNRQSMRQEVEVDSMQAQHVASLKSIICVLSSGLFNSMTTILGHCQQTGNILLKCASEISLSSLS